MPITTLELALSLRVQARREIATDIVAFSLVAAEPGGLPAFTAGAHLSIMTPAGIVNKYSIASSPNDRTQYVIAIKREAQGRGGSKSMVDELRVGATLQASLPDNAFEYLADRPGYIFVAGGIGITPIHSMICAMREAGIDNYRLYYLARDAASTAWREELLEAGPRVVVHHSRGAAPSHFDLWPVFEKPRKSLVYCCGPQALMESVRDMTGHWPRNAIKFERFGVDPATRRANQPFDVQLARSGARVHVAADVTLLEALRAQGLAIPSSCESGTCGTCITGLVSGDVDHRDLFLEDAQKEDHLMVCVSRARSGTLVLDL